ncbi:MAG TPA: GerMN domain-containing protein [Ilumatobacteraceae bacterium]|nr:GerMN domain-containing protein [Ilumatobacteraceae bacterium]
MTERHWRRRLGLLVVGVFSTACGVATGDDTFQAVPDDEIPFGLDVTSTTTTTTTTTTLPDAPTTTLPATTTTIRLEPVEIYFLSRGRLQPVPFELPPGFSADQVADVLEAGPPDGFALDTLIEDGLIVSSTESGGVLAVDLDADVFDRIAASDQTEAIGQIVLTMISSLRRVGQVSFTLGGEPIPVKKGNGLSSEVGEPLSYDDYANLLARPRLAPEPATAAEATTGTTTTDTAP